MVRRDEVGVDGEPEDPQALVEVVLPDRRVPVGRTAFEQLAAPDVVDEQVDVAVVVPDPLGQARHLVGVEMVDSHGDSRATEVGDDVRRLLDGLPTVVVGPERSRRAAATGTYDSGARFAEGGGDSTACTPGRTRHDSHTTSEGVPVRRPAHRPESSRRRLRPPAIRPPSPATPAAPGFPNSTAGYEAPGCPSLQPGGSR